MTIPVVSGVPVDVDAVWRYLREPAEFFEVPMPERAELAAALSEYFATVGNQRGPALALVNVTIGDGEARILLSGTPVRPTRADAVRIAVDDSVIRAHRATDPSWRVMAARTTSRGEVDQLERTLDAAGYADVTSDGVPHLGALVFAVDQGFVAVENPVPTSVLDQLERCGAISAIARVDRSPVDAAHAWWISPRYETHPVAEIGGTRISTGAEAAAPFARLS